MGRGNLRIEEQEMMLISLNHKMFENNHKNQCISSGIFIYTIPASN